jgi:ribosomal protein S18 acetylase RimI-like enzyme
METMITIRQAKMSDAGTIVRFNVLMAEETEGVLLDESRVAAGVASALADPGKALYFLAERDGRPVGQLMITYEWSDWRNGVFWWIQSVYVEPESRRQGVYRALYADLVRRARERSGVCGVRLYVERHNARAQAAYESLGMSRAPYEMFEVDFVLSR